MKNTKFLINLDENTGFITSIVNPTDEYRMNWCAEDGSWSKLHQRNWNAFTGELGVLPGKEMNLCSFIQDEVSSKAVYSNGELMVTVTRWFKENGNFVENYTLKNVTPTVLCVNRDNFGIETPFNDRYTNADECMIRHCHTHIWCGHHVAWVNALKMGISDINLGLFLTKGALDCYDQNNCHTNHRGIFVLEPESLLLKSGEEYELEWELFWHESKDDFHKVISGYDRYIGIDAVHYTVFEGENIEFTVTVESGEVPQVTCQKQLIPVSKEDGCYRVIYEAPKAGEYRFEIRAGEVHTWTDFKVKIPFRTLLENRVKFIVRNQQCLDKDSPLYGSFLVYDNEYDSPYFDYSNPDHNACRERMNIPLLLMKYLQMKDDPEVRAAIDIFIQFVFREFYEETTGEVFNTIGKNKDQVRPYNPPGVMLVFTEMYFVTKDEFYLKHILKLADNYYAAGGKKCYANGIAIAKVIRAFRTAGWDKEAERMMEHFKSHVDNIIGNGTSYPKHEVNYEQTIVTPAVNHISEFGALSEDKEYYIKEATKHLECLERFSGMQPSFHLYEIAIRYWDDYWFGKNRTFGDTLPHHLSCLTSRAYLAYSLLTGKKEWMDRAEEGLRNCMCLVGDDARGAAAYVYPYKLNGRRGEFYDPWSNDQDLVLYDGMYFSEYMDIFKLS